MEPQPIKRALPSGSALAVIPSGVSFLQPEEAVLGSMLTGWANQQTSRHLSPITIEKRELTVKRFVAFTNDYPWRWSSADVEEWSTSMVSAGLSHATLRNYQQTVALFIGYLCDLRYGWDTVCETRFGTHPVQVFHEGNTAEHRSENEGRPTNRPFSREEALAFFTFCDERVAAVADSGRKGWLAAYRDSVLFKVIYAWGLRRNEAAMLDVSDWSANASAPQFGRFGALSVRYGKASKGSPPKRRSVLTSMLWAAEAVDQWVKEIRPEYATASGPMMWPTERGGRMTSSHIGARFNLIRDAMVLDPALHPHCLRHAYVTHQLEDGYDHLFIQQQVGHAWGSTTALYTSVSSDYKNEALKRALRRAYEDEETDS